MTASKTVLMLIVMTLAASCAHTSNSDSGGREEIVVDGKKAYKPAPMKPTGMEIPKDLAKIEGPIEMESVILADEAEIFVSKNYEYDVSLTGDNVSKDLDPSGRNERVALGVSTAILRNLQIRCDKKIRVRVAGFGTKPFIRVQTKGHCSHIILNQNGSKPFTKKSAGVMIHNDKLRYLGATNANASEITVGQQN